MFGASLVFATNMLARFFSLGLFLLLVRYVPKEQFGEYSYLLTKAAAISSFFMNPLAVVASRFSGDSSRNRHAVVSFIVVQTLLTGIALLPAAVLVDQITAPSLATGWHGTLLIFAAAVGMVLFQVIQSLLYGLRKYERAAVFTLAGPGLQLVVVSSSLLLFGSVTLAALYVSVCCSLLVGVASVLLWYRRLAPVYFPAGLRNELLKFQRPFFLSSAISSPVGLLIASLLLALTNLTEIARYNVCLQIGQLVVFVPAAMYPYYIGRLSHASEGLRGLLRATIELGILMLAVFLAYRIYAEAIVSVVLPQYVDIVPAATPFVIWGCILGLKMPAIAFLDGRGKAWLTFFISTFGAVALVAASFALVGYSLPGLGWARAMSAIFEALLTLGIVLWSVRKDRNPELPAVNAPAGRT